MRADINHSHSKINMCIPLGLDIAYNYIVSSFFLHMSLIYFTNSLWRCQRLKPPYSSSRLSSLILSYLRLSWRRWSPESLSSSSRSQSLLFHRLRQNFRWVSIFSLGFQPIGCWFSWKNLEILGVGCSLKVLCSSYCNFLFAGLFLLSRCRVKYMITVSGKCKHMIKVCNCVWACSIIYQLLENLCLCSFK